MACCAVARDGTVAHLPALSFRTCPLRLLPCATEFIRGKGGATFLQDSFAPVRLQFVRGGVTTSSSWSEERPAAMGSSSQSTTFQGSRAYFPASEGYHALNQNGRSTDLSSIVVCSSTGGAASWNGGAAESWGEDPDSAEQSRKAAIAKKVKKAVAGVDQSQLVDPWQLADPDSRFADFYGVQLHFKVAGPRDKEDPPSTSFARRHETVDLSEARTGAMDISYPPPAILLHGFGASLFSFERIMRPLALLLQSQVLAFDRPAFGLTSRASYPFTKAAAGVREKVAEAGNTSLLNPYSLGFSSAAAISFVDLLQSEQAILVGHSAGCIVAANAYLEAPERVAGIIMLAPALVAPLVVKEFRDAGNVQRDSVTQEKATQRQNGLVAGLSTAWGAVVSVALALVGFVTSALAGIGSILKSISTSLLRTSFAAWVVRLIMDKGGRWIVRHAWFDPLKADDYVMDGYTKPLGCKDWDKALLEFVISLAGGSEGERSLGERLREVSCPVLVVTGDSDRLVPAWNAERLSKVFPRAQFKLIKDCGHLPHEEKVEETLALIREFVESLRGSTGAARNIAGLQAV